jgi:hypothetical protein
MLIFDSNGVGKGFRVVEENELVQTFDQYYSYSTHSWVVSGHFSSEKYQHTNRVAYRRPITFFAKLRVFPSVVNKYFQLLKTKFKK